MKFAEVKSYIKSLSRRQKVVLGGIAAILMLNPFVAANRSESTQAVETEQPKLTAVERRAIEKAVANFDKTNPTWLPDRNALFSATGAILTDRRIIEKMDLFCDSDYESASEGNLRDAALTADLSNDRLFYRTFEAGNIAIYEAAKSDYCPSK
ncbi:hypothetical protein [Chroococcidiopsis sp.]|uniref:hypothetical protein n=1 Tax=Chroococcidiopsis sp. TaxID=3088168 RepID=UPI003F3846A1